MTFASLINLLTIALCGAVLVQGVRITRALAALRTANLPASVTALEAATTQAETVLKHIRDTLREGAEPQIRMIGKAQDVADELGVMIGIADATADRLLGAAREGRPAAYEAQDLAA